ncbi:disulfide bond formation protein B [Shewanella sp. YIC-542]|uniref:disulfide bond formation protein B n=1 Tax=Shewanella mytili TaxID=3377111 RepID=UPI00398E5127
MSSIIQFIKDLFTNPSKVHEQRAPWYVMAGVALSALITAGLYFQMWLAAEPCEQCVYIREAQFFILLGGIAILINPKVIGLKVVGLASAWTGVFYGLVCSVKLSGIEKAMHLLQSDNDQDLFSSGAGANACSLEPHFLTGLPLDVWWPTEFKPGGICGEFQWELFGLGMADYCIIIFAAFGICLLPLTYAFIKKLVTKQ